MAYQIIWENRGVFVDCSGKLTIQDIHEANGELHGDKRFDDHRYQVWDFLESDLSSIKMDEMEEPAATDLVASSYAPNVKVAIVVSESYAVELTSHYRATSLEDNSNWECELFKTMNAARKWIDSN